MFRDTPSYDKAVKRIIHLQEMEKNLLLSRDQVYELDLLLIATSEYEAALDAEALAEYEFMQRFEDQFMASMER